MKPFFLSVAEGIIQNPKNRVYRTQATISTFDDLKRAVQYDHVAGHLKNDMRGNENFISADALIMDCDNGHSDDPSLWLTPEKLRDILPDTEYTIVYSRNHMKVKTSGEGENTKEISARDRFHIYLPMRQPVTEAETIRDMKERLIALIPELDDGAKDATRLIYGVKNPQGFHFKGSMCIDEFFAQHSEPSFDYEVTEIPHDVLMQSLDGTITQPEEENDSDFDEEPRDIPAESDIIHEGKRNTTLYRTACRLIRKYGENNAIQPFNIETAKCQPPLPPDEIADIWKHALKFVRSELKKEQKKRKKEKKQSDDERLCIVRDSFLADRLIFFHGSNAHGEYYEYDSKAGFWYSLTDAELYAELSAFLNHKNIKDIGRLAMMIRVKNTRAILPEWNKGRLDNFPNGTLELDTGILREHRPEDYLTYQHTFDYNPGANEAPVFDTFMPAITLGEQSRIDHLTDMLAYGLYEDSRLEKLFFLIGNGSNGKGVFMHLAEDLFRSANPRNSLKSVSYVAPSDMDKPTERVQLEGAKLNLAFDTKEDMRGCSSYLKSLAGNDTITGNHKFHDSHSFVNRAKFISSCNHIPKFDDDSYGLRRKIMFCRFAATFKNGEADTTLREKLQAELPAIYNRIYKAYQELRKREATCGQDAIRPSCDQPELITEHTMFADPIRAFWFNIKDEFSASREIPKSAVYAAFRKFAEANNIDLVREGIREYSFHKKFFAVLSEDSDITASNTLRRRDSEDNKKQVYYYRIGRKPDAHIHEPEEERTPPAPEQATPPEHSPSETPPEEDTTAGNEAMTQSADNTETPPPMSEEDAHKWERLLNGEKIEYTEEDPL